MDGSEDGVSWLYEQGKASFDRRDYDTALTTFTYCRAKLLERVVNKDHAKTAYRHLDQYLELCETRAEAARLHRAADSDFTGPATDEMGAYTPAHQTPHILGAGACGGSGSAYGTHSSSPQHAERETLIFVCSPKNAPLPQSADEAMDVSNAVPSRICRGGSAEELRRRGEALTHPIPSQLRPHRLPSSPTLVCVAHVTATQLPSPPPSLQLLRSRYRSFLFSGHGDAPTRGRRLSDAWVQWPDWRA